MEVLKLPKEKVLLSRKDLKELGIHKSNVSLLRAEAAKRFPARARLNGTTVVWFRHEVEAYLKAIAAERAHYAYGELR